MKQVTVGLGERSYPIWIGCDHLPKLKEALDAVGFPRRIGIITNPTVGALYGERVTAALCAGNRQVHVIQIPDGEQYKTLETLEQVYDTLIDWRFDRSCGLLALGGGVIGDLTGFAAATFMRGIPFVQVPTTLLAQVDSSVGGKTGVNHPRGKNLIGAFYQPRYVHCDVGMLATLPPREYAAGLAEIVKYGVIRDAGFFSWLEREREALLARSPEALEHAVMISCQIKADVVESDENEQGLRAILNYGHTFGHAVETLAGYGVVLHGEAVSIGMVMAARASALLGFGTAGDADRISRLLQSFNLPVNPPDFAVGDYLEVMRHDKKVRDGSLRLVLNHGIGAADLHQADAPDRLLDQLLA
ncbi:MAG: 3-dehydroquinate synthase [Deltaproteobacteria bacterium]|nr:MAG: 3-dehydroquinate synthase [Deltaproteobacteria bacterium]